MFVTQNAYPREALLEAILRFLEEDLAGAMPPSKARVLCRGATMAAGAAFSFLEVHTAQRRTPRA